MLLAVPCWECQTPLCPAATRRWEKSLLSAAVPPTMVLLPVPLQPGDSGEQLKGARGLE